MALDLLGKVLLNPGDRVIIEEPGYFGAIQAFSFYEPVLQAVPLETDGINLEKLEQALRQGGVKLFYTVSNFQNPSGITYSQPKRQAVVNLLRQYGVTLVEDNPYGDLRFTGADLPLMATYAGGRAILLGSFSKTVAPGLRLGWICAGQKVMEKLIIAKEAADLHSNYLAQRIVYQYLQDYNLDEHLACLRPAYKQQCDGMIEAIKTYLPPEVRYTQPEGGMFIWLTLPPGLSSSALVEAAARLKVAFVPGKAFYLQGGGEDTLRLNFSNSEPDQIRLGIKSLAEAMTETCLVI